MGGEQMIRIIGNA